MNLHDGPNTDKRLELQTAGIAKIHQLPRLCQKLNSPHGSVEMFQIISMRPTLDPLRRALRAGGNESCFSVETI